jgi:hypothetical protein
LRTDFSFRLAYKMPRVPPPERLPNRMPRTRQPIRLADSSAREQRPVIRVELPCVPPPVNRCRSLVYRVTAFPAVVAIVIMAPERRAGREFDSTHCAAFISALMRLIIHRVMPSFVANVAIPELALCKPIIFLKKIRFSLC